MIRKVTSAHATDTTGTNWITTGPTTSIMTGTMTGTTTGVTVGYNSMPNS